MNKYQLFLLTILLLSSEIAFANSAFTTFTPNMQNNSSELSEQNYINTMNQNACSNPYENNINSNGSRFKFFNNRNSDANNYPVSSVQNTDVEYLLSKMEKSQFSKNYSNLDIQTRLSKLEAEIFGTIQSGDYNSRLNRLKHAYASGSDKISSSDVKSRLSGLRELFSFGTPTSIPASQDYYTSLAD